MGSERDEFDDIVRGLDINVSFPDDNDGEPDLEPDLIDPDRDLDEGDINQSGAPDDQILPGDDLSYRDPAPPPLRPWSIARIIAITGIIAGPMLLMFATLSGIVLSRPVAYGLTFIFVACAVWLIAQLPERGPGRPDSPDDGAEL